MSKVGEAVEAEAVLVGVEVVLVGVAAIRGQRLAGLLR